MQKLRVAAAATVIALLAAFASMGTASAASSGVGTTETTTSLVDVALGTNGSILHLRVLGDDAKATVDPAVGPLSAFSQLFALKATSSVLPGLSNLSIPTPPFESRSPGGTANFTGPALNLGTVVPVLGTSVVSGALAPVNLTSSATSGVAKSGLSANLANVGLVGGLIKVDAVKSTLGAVASGDSADGARSLKVDAVSVLNLGSLLEGLGIDLANLPVGIVSSMLGDLNVPVAGVPATASLEGFVASLNTTITGLNAQLSDTFAVLPDPIKGVLGGLNLPAETGGVIPDPTAVTTLLAQVTDVLEGVLETALTTLDNVTLLKFNGLEVGTVTKAVNGIAGSKSEVIGKLGSTSIGGITVPGLDLSSTLGTVTSTVNTITSTLDGVLAPLGLDGILSVKFFDKPTSNGVSTSGGYTRSLAGITGAAVAIKPPADLLNIVNGLLPANGIGSAITGAGGTVPVVGGLMNTLNGASGLPAVGGVISALAGGVNLKVASVATGSNFALPGAVATPAPVAQLARTGDNTTAFLVIGMLMVGAAIVGRRFIPSRVKSDS